MTNKVVDDKQGGHNQIGDNQGWDQVGDNYGNDNQVGDIASVTTKVVLRPSDNQFVENQIVDRVVTTKRLTTKVLATKMVDQGGDQVNNQCVDNQIVHLERFNSSSLLRVSANSAWILSRTVPVGWKRVFCFYSQSGFFSSHSSSGFAWWAIFVQFHFCCTWRARAVGACTFGTDCKRRRGRSTNCFFLA